jgi:hypothetical protein
LAIIKPPIGSDCQIAVSRYLIRKRKQKKSTEDIMADKVQNYIETDDEREEGHVDTRRQNHECENKDPHLGCNLGIDVAG